MAGYKDEFLRSDVRRSDEFFNGDIGFSSEFIGASEYAYSNLNETEIADESFFHKDEFNMESDISLKQKASGEGELELSGEPSQTLAIGAGTVKVGAITVAAVMSVSAVAINHEHVFTNGWTVFREASCHHTGIEELICSDCGWTTQKRETNTLEHSVSEWITQNLATCQSGGIEVRKCTECMALLEERKIAPSGHSWISSENGMVCSVCGEGESSPSEEVSSSSEIFEEESSSSSQVEQEESSSSSEEVVEETSSNSQAEQEESSENVVIPPVVNYVETPILPPQEDSSSSSEPEQEESSSSSSSGDSSSSSEPEQEESSSSSSSGDSSSSSEPEQEESSSSSSSDGSSSSSEPVECKHENEEVTILDATCTESGERKVVCADCYHEIETEIIEPQGHKYADGVCENCDEPCDHSYDANGTCETCGMCEICLKFDENKNCTICGSPCKHNNYDGGICVGCGEYCTHDSYDDNGCCKACYMECLHQYDLDLNGNCDECNIYLYTPRCSQCTTYGDDGTCIDCGWPQICGDEVGCSGYNQYGVCEVCGAPCNHRYTENGFCGNCDMMCPHTKDAEGDFICDDCTQRIECRCEYFSPDNQGLCSICGKPLPS